jgi:hypothetical protein
MDRNIKLRCANVRVPVSVIYDYEFITQADSMLVNFYESSNILDLYYGELKSEFE